MTGSFKERGALNRLLTLTPDEAKRGVIAASAGNHGMALAFHSQRLKIAATIVMPLHAPLIKVSRVRQLWRPKPYSTAPTTIQPLRKLSASPGKRTHLDSRLQRPWVVAGQGTIGLELYEQNPDLNAVVVPVGGGGLIAGIGLVLKTINPEDSDHRRASGSPPIYESCFRKGRPIRLPPAMTIADGIAVREVGKTTLELVKNYVDEIVTVNEGEIANAVLLLLETEKQLWKPLLPLHSQQSSTKTGLANTNVGPRYLRR